MINPGIVGDFSTFLFPSYFDGFGVDKIEIRAVSDLSGGQDYLQIDNLVVEISVVPVPAAVWLFGSGLIGLIGIARRQKS